MCKHRSGKENAGLLKLMKPSSHATFLTCCILMVFIGVLMAKIKNVQVHYLKTHIIKMFLSHVSMVLGFGHSCKENPKGENQFTQNNIHICTLEDAPHLF